MENFNLSKTEDQKKIDNLPEKERGKVAGETQEETNKIVADKVDKNEELIKRLSKTVLRVAENDRRSLFEKMTSKNAEKIAELLKKKPIFYENKEDAPQQILLDVRIADLFPKEFFKNPTQWIESQKNIERFEINYRSSLSSSFPSGRKIDEIWDRSYDISKVKEFAVGNNDNKVEIVSKRLDKKQLEEIILARRAWEAGIPTPKVLGEIIDQGNSYVFFEKISAINLLTLSQLMPDKAYKYVYERVDYDKKRFCEGIDSSFDKILSDNAKERIYLIWEEEKKEIRLNEILWRIRDFLGQYIFRYIGLKFNDKTSIESEADKVFSEIMSEFSSDEIKKAIAVLGFKDKDELLKNFILKKNILEETKKLDRENKIKEFEQEEKKRFSGLGERTEKINKKFEEQVKSEFYKEKFGIDIPKKVSELESLCLEKGLEHKDFAKRNILIEWNFDKGEPLKKQGEKEPKLYIIDWEPKPKSPQKQK